MAKAKANATPVDNWYVNQKKPRWTVGQKRYQQAWSLLYPLILGSFFYVFYRTYKTYYPVATVVPFVANLVFNALYPVSLFVLRSNLAAVAVAIATDVTLVSAMFVVWPYSHVVTIVLIPYLAWMLYITVWQIRVLTLNWRTTSAAKTT